nr:restriction endonuclease [Gulosibacter chungangensis]
MGVGQQAVSGWERGISRPRRSVLKVLCSILDLCLDDVLDAGRYEQARDTPSQSRLLNLPFENLSPEAFEAFCRDLLQMRHPRRTAVRNGSSGFKQFGVDVYVDGEDERIGVQCKRHRTFGPSDVKKAIEEVLPDAQLSSGVIALSRRSATPATRLELTKYPGWKLWDGETLSGFVRGLQVAEKLALIESYFPELRESFLGISEPSPWLEPDRYDTALAGRLGVDRNFALVGRTDELRKLTALAADHREVAFVIGRGGIGKSRLLREFASADIGRAVRFVARGRIAPSAFELLPEGAPVIVVDDATDAEYDVAALVEGVRRARPDATLVLAARPRAVPKLRASLDLPEALADDVTVSVGDLSIEDAESLARDALGDHATDWRVESLARIGYDCPFLIVTGSHLVRSGTLDDSDLASQTVLRREILARFTDLVLSGANADARTAVLQALAAIQPAPLEDGDFIQCLVAASGQSHADLLEILDELEDLGLVLRRGKTARVVPDLLGDATLERALVSQSGLDKHFARLIADHAGGSALTHAINNVSIVDWHRRADGDSNLADVLWHSLVEHTRDLPNSARINISRRVAAVAAIYPDRALDFADTLRANPAPDEDDELSGIWGEERKVTSDDVARSLAPLIANAGHRTDYLPRALHSLLDIGLRDDRGENSNPEHALRLARELGEFHPRRPVAFTKRYVEVVGDIFRADEYPGHRDQILSLLSPALADEVTITEPKGISITIARMPVSLEAVADVRSSAIAIAEEALARDTWTARAAIAIFEEALRSGDRNEPVTDEFAVVVGILSRLLGAPDQSAGLRLSAYRALGWHAKYGVGERKELVRDTRRRLHIDDDLLFIRLVRAGWASGDDYDTDDTDDDAAGRYHQAREKSERVTEELVERWTTRYTSDGLVQRLQEIIKEERTASDEHFLPDRLLTRFFQKSPDAARIVVNSPPSETVDQALIRAALLVLLGRGDTNAEQAALDMIDSGSEPAKVVASAVINAPGAFNEARTNVVRALLATNYSDVHTILLSAARWFEAGDRALILEMLNAVPIEFEPIIAEEALGALDGQGAPWLSLSPAERSRLLKRLEATPRLPAYELGRVLKKQLSVDPYGAVRFLQRRVERRTSEGREYEPFPDIKSMDLGFASNSRRPALIDVLIEWILADDSWERHFFGEQILESMANDFDAQFRSVIFNLIRSREENRIRLARNLLNDAPQDFVIREPEFVADVLEVAGELESDLRIQVFLGLHGSAQFGMRSRTIGVDDPNEIALCDGANVIADRYSEGSTVRDFYLEVVQRATCRLESNRQNDLSRNDPRSWG